MCSQAEELIAAVSTQAMNEQREINSHDCFTQQHVEPWLALLPGRRQQRNQGRHTCRERTRIQTHKMEFVPWIDQKFAEYKKHRKTKNTISAQYKIHLYNICRMAWSVSAFPFPSQRPWGSYYRTPSASLYKHRLPALLYFSSDSAFYPLNHVFDAHPYIFASCEDSGIWTCVELSFNLFKTISWENCAENKPHFRAELFLFCSIFCFNNRIEFNLTRTIPVVGKAEALLPGHCAGAELGVTCSSMLSVRSLFLSLSNRPWYTIPVNWLASVWMLQRQQHNCEPRVSNTQNKFNSLGNLMS